jgi:hypothetical protein
LTVGQPPAASVQVDELGPQKFSLVVSCDGQRFECGTYISRAAALLAGRLFVQRKQGEHKRPRKKGG